MEEERKSKIVEGIMIIAGEIKVDGNGIPLKE